MSAGIESAQPLAKFGTVWRLRGEASAESDPVGVRRLRLGDSVYVGETIQTHSTGEAVLRTEDAGLVALRPGASFIIDQYAARGQTSDRFDLRLLAGSLRIISGWVARVNPDNYRIRTATATIGIRGTDHEPYVLSREFAQTLKAREGTYDKVNRGGTTLEAQGSNLEIAPGQVGFAPARTDLRERGLFTILLPVILDVIPDFYVPGAFDAELEVLSLRSEVEGMRAYHDRRSAPIPQERDKKSGKSSAIVPPYDRPTTEPKKEAALGITASGVPSSGPSDVAASACNDSEIASKWLAQFDTSVLERRAQSIVNMFAPEATVRAHARKADGSYATIEMGRDVLAQSTIEALRGLTDYSQRRISVETSIVRTTANECFQINVRSVVIERGRQGNMPYQIEAMEEYVLEYRDRTWLAISASTTQQ